MNLSDALGDWPSGNQSQSGGGAAWPGQPSATGWPGAPSSGGPAQPGWPGAPSSGGPAQPSWPSAPSSGGPAQPGWPSAPSSGGPAQPGWPGAPSSGGPAQPGWPSAPSGGPAQPSWPSAPSSGGPAQPGWPGSSGHEGWPSHPGPGGFPSPSPSPGFPAAPQQNLKVPYEQKFPHGLQDNNLITICGTVKPHPNMITIDFNVGNDIVFHFNPRFNENGKQVIVRNSCCGKKWGKEERELPCFPFVAGKNFEMKILVTSSSFKVAVNNSHLLEYKHRSGLKLKDIRSMNIYCDVALTRVTVE